MRIARFSRAVEAPLPNFRKSRIMAAIRVAATATLLLTPYVAGAANETVEPNASNVSEKSAVDAVRSRRRPDRHHYSHGGCRGFQNSLYSGCAPAGLGYDYIGPPYNTGYWETGFDTFGGLFSTLLGPATAPLLAPPASIYGR
jgi:hypothetical protein